jgi:hypothetical protein
MTPRELRRQMRRQKTALRSSMKQTRKQVRAQVDQLPAVRRERRRRAVRRTLLLALILLLLCLIRCDCQSGPAAEPVAAEPIAEVVKPKVVVRAPVKRAPLQGATAHQPRSAFPAEAPGNPTWLEEFHLQVAARSPRLAQCFTGSDRPGALRWTSSVNPESGAVSDHELEPVGPASELGHEQRECIIRALSSPNYKLTVPKAEALPNRIGLVIEF